MSKAVMVPLIISHDGAVHRDTVRRWKSFAPDMEVDCVRMAQSILRYNVVIVGKFFNEGSWVSEKWRKDHLEEFDDKHECLQKELLQLMKEEGLYRSTLSVMVLSSSIGHATSTRCSADVY